MNAHTDSGNCSYLGDILRTKEKWLSITKNTIAANKKRDRECELVMWIDLANRANHTVKLAQY